MVDDYPVLYDPRVPSPNPYSPPLMPVISAEAMLASKRPDLAYDLLHYRDRQRFQIQADMVKYNAICAMAQASAHALVRAIETRGDNSEVEIGGTASEPGFLGICERKILSFKWRVKYKK